MWRIHKEATNHRLVNRVGCLVWENARREARHAFDDLELVAAVQHVVVDVHVVAPELQVALHVGEQAADLCCQMNHMRGPVLLEDRPRQRHIAVYKQSEHLLSPKTRLRTGDRLQTS